ncbi:MAG: glycosyltransferase family 4 protein [Sulfitobacter sp.]
MTDLFVTNFNPHFTGVSATTANVLRQQIKRHDVKLVGMPLPGCPAPITRSKARALCRSAPGDTPFSIWHVRRNTEMRAALWARDALRLPIRIVFTSAAQRRHSAFPRWLISRMDAVVATTETAASFVPNVRGVVPHGVDTDIFTPAANRATAWAAMGYGGTQGIATIGRIRPEKGTDLFVQAMLRLLPQRPGLVALVVGRAGGKHDGFLAGLKQQIAAAGLTDRILFPGEIAPEALPSLMRSLSLVCQLPRYEGYGMVPLEAMASGVPFVASDAGYYAAFSAQGRSGSIVPLDAPDAAADAALGLMENADFDTMAMTAREIADTQFSARIEADGIEAVYQQLWSEGRR